VALSINYRLADIENGIGYDGMIADAKCAVRFFRAVANDYGIDRR